jgi:hypothetical protein
MAIAEFGRSSAKAEPLRQRKNERPHRKADDGSTDSDVLKIGADANRYLN